MTAIKANNESPLADVVARVLTAGYGSAEGFKLAVELDPIDPHTVIALMEKAVRESFLSIAPLIADLRSGIDIFDATSNGPSGDEEFRAALNLSDAAVQLLTAIQALTR